MGFFLEWFLQSVPLVGIGLGKWDKKIIPVTKHMSEILLMEWLLHSALLAWLIMQSWKISLNISLWLNGTVYGHKLQEQPQVFNFRNPMSVCNLGHQVFMFSQRRMHLQRTPSEHLK